MPRCPRVRDTAFPLARLWCLLETATACQLQVPTTIWPHGSADLAALQAAAEHLRLDEASATDRACEDALRAAIAAALRAADFHPSVKAQLRRGGGERGDDGCESLRRFLVDRIDCFIEVGRVCVSVVGRSSGPLSLGSSAIG